MTFQRTFRVVLRSNIRRSLPACDTHLYSRTSRLHLYRWDSTGPHSTRYSYRPRRLSLFYFRRDDPPDRRRSYRLPILHVRVHYSRPPAHRYSPNAIVGLCCCCSTCNPIRNGFPRNRRTSTYSPSIHRRSCQLTSRQLAICRRTSRVLRYPRTLWDHCRGRNSSLIRHLA